MLYHDRMTPLSVSTSSFLCRLGTAVFATAATLAAASFPAPVWAATTQTRASGFGYDATSGLLTQEVVEPDATDNKRLQTDYVYDAFGHTVSVTVSGIDVTTRTST